MELWKVFPTISGYERVGSDQVRLYVDGPNPEPRFDRPHGVRTCLFRLYAGRDAEAVLRWLDRNRVWECMRVPPPLTPQKGGRAVLVASDWHSGEGSALYAFARDRVIESEAHRQRLQREVRVLISSVIENPVTGRELADLQVVEDVVNVALLGVEVASTTDVVMAFFGTPG